VIAVDVDGTIHQSGVVNRRLLDWLVVKKSSGYELMLWSARGTDHARKLATLTKSVDLFDVMVAVDFHV
jgi:hydroxymethylpyrimidine pyrophosphatase-like HAD family hydrolase